MEVVTNTFKVITHLYCMMWGTFNCSEGRLSGGINCSCAWLSWYLGLCSAGQMAKVQKGDNLDVRDPE